MEERGQDRANPEATMESGRGTIQRLKRAFKEGVVIYTIMWARLVVRVRRPMIIGITGSVGKTTAKEIIGSALMHEAVRPYLGLVWRTHGNMNDLRGLPQAVLGYDFEARSRWPLVGRLCSMPFRALRLMTVGPYPRYLVLEYGLGTVTTIRELAEIAPPTVAIVTAVGPAHMNSYATVADVAVEKSALVAAAPPTGLVVLGADNAYTAIMDRVSRAPVRKIPGSGREFAQSAARVIGEYLGVPSDVLEQALAEHVPLRGRQELIELGPVRLLSDAFNANQLSMQYGLAKFGALARPGERRIAVLGSMAELGAEAPRYHREIGTTARPLADVLIGVGELAKHYDPDLWYMTSMDCATALPSLLRANDFVFVKGSAAVELYRVTNTVRQIAPGFPPATR